MIRVFTFRGYIHGHLVGKRITILSEYESITNRLVHLGFTQEEISRAAARGIVTGQEEVEENDHM